MCHDRGEALVEQLHDEGGAEDDDDLKQSLRRKDPVERRHFHTARCLDHGGIAPRE